MKVAMPYQEELLPEDIEVGDFDLGI